MAISMLKIRRPLGRLIFNMGIAIPGKTVFLIETAPCFWYKKSSTVTLIMASGAGPWLLCLVDKKINWQDIHEFTAEQFITVTS